MIHSTFILHPNIGMKYAGDPFNNYGYEFCPKTPFKWISCFTSNTHIRAFHTGVAPLLVPASQLFSRVEATRDKTPLSVTTKIDSSNSEPWRHSQAN